MERPATTVVDAAAGRVLHAFGDEISIYLDGAATDGKLCAFVTATPPGGGPPPHWHENEDEWFFPMEGRVEFLLDGSWREVPVGSFVFAPRRSVHTFRNVGDAPLKMLIQLSPAGFETFFERCAEEFGTPGPPDMQRIVEISAEHGIHFVDG